MNLFRSEEHVHKWSGFKAKSEQGFVQRSEMVRLFSGNFFKTFGSGLCFSLNTSAFEWQIVVVALLEITLEVELK